MANIVQLASAALTLPLLTRAESTIDPVQSQFLQKLSDTLGDHLTPADGFDDLINTPLSTIDAESATIDSLGSAVSDAAFTPGEFATGTLDPIARDIGSFNSAGDTIITTFGGDVAPPPAPPATPPAPPATPPTDGGGGGGGNDPRSNQGGPGLPGYDTVWVDTFARVF